MLECYRIGREETLVHIELTSLKGLAEAPIGRNGIQRGHGHTVAGPHSEGDCLTNQDSVCLPVLSPVSLHGLPFGVGSHDVDCEHIAFTANIVN